MRRNIKNDKVLRAITIGLATMIAVTSSPITVLADSNDEPANDETTVGGAGNQDPDTQPEQNNVNNSAEGEQQQQQPSIPENVQGATSGLQQSAKNIETKKETPEGSTEEQVVGGIEAAKAAADKIIVPNGNGSSIVVTKVELKDENGKAINLKDENGNTITEATNVSAQTVKDDLVKAEGILLNTKDETTGKDVGIYNDLGELQGAINNFYLANKSLNDKIGEFVEKDENGDLVFSVNNAKYQIVTIPGATENDATQYMVLKVENTGTTNLANVNEAFDTTIVDANGNDSRAKIQSDNADAAVEAARKSNNAGNQADAENYKATALSLIKAVEDDFAIDSQKFEEAAQFANAAKEKLDEIEGQAATVNQRLNDIKNELNDLIGEDKQGGKATALNEQLKAAQAKALALKQEAERQRSTISQYELLLQIREADKNVQAEVEKNKAEAERIKKAQAEGQELDTKIPSVSSGNYWKEARKLCYLLVEYYINNGDLAVMDANGEPIALTEGRQLEIGADFEKVLTYSEPDFDAETTTDAKGNPMYRMKEVKDDYSITGTGADQRSKFEFVKKDENGNITGMAYKTIDDKETGMGWIFASSEKSNDCNNNRFVVNIKDKDGNIIGTAYFNAKPNDDGSVYIYERECFEKETKHTGVAGVKGQEAIEAKDAVPESWATADGNKQITVNQETHELETPNTTTHVVARPDDEEGNKTGYWVIDTETSTVLKEDYQPDSLMIKNGTTTTTYTDGGNQTVTYTYGSDQVWDGTYQKKTGTKDGKPEDVSIFDLSKKITSLQNEGYEVTLQYRKAFSEEWETINQSDLGFGDTVLSVIRGVFGIDGLKVSTNEIDDTTKPNKVERSGIFETVTQLFTETSVDSGLEDTGWKGDGWGNGEDDAINAKNRILENLNARGITEANGYTITVNEIKDWKSGIHDDKTKFQVSYTKTVTNENVSRVVGKKFYEADTYTNHTLHEDAVAAKAEVKEVIGYDEYTTKTLGWMTDKESQDKAKSEEMVGKANSLKTVNVEVDGKTKTRTVNKTSYKELLTQLAAKDEEVAGYDNLYNKVQSAVKASEKFVELLQRFTYPAGFSYTAGSATVSDAPQHGDLTPGDAANTRLVDSLTLDNFESTVGALLGNLKESVYNTFENISVAKDRQEKLAQKIRDARAAVNGIRDTDRFADNDDDDDDDDDSGVTPGAGTFVLPGAGASTLASFDLSGMTFDDGRGVAGARTGRRSVASTNSGSGVLGARTESENKEPVVVNDTKNKDSKGSTEKDNKKLEKIENNQIPLADAPFAEAFGLNWLWMLLAGAVGVGAYSYDRHRKKAAANEEMKKYKK